MTRLFTDGAEFGDELFWDVVGNLSATAGGRSGSYRYVHGTTNVNSIKYLNEDISEFYFRTVFYLSTSYGTDHFIRFYDDSNLVISFYMSGVNLAAAVGGGNVATGASVIGASKWYLFECYAKIADAPDGRIITKIDGIVDIDYTGDTLPSSYSTINQFALNRTGSSYQVWFDDIAFNDINGIVDNSWCGDGHVELLKANNNGDVNSWVGQDADSVNNYLNVDDVPPDSDTTYNKGTVDATQDMYNVVDFTATGKIVTRIFSEGRAKDAAALSGTIKTGFKTDGTVYLSSSYTSLSSSYQRVVGDEAIINPFDSGVWEDADLDAIQYVIECSISSSSSSSSTSSSSSSSSTTSSSSSTEIP